MSWLSFSRNSYHFYLPALVIVFDPHVGWTAGRPSKTNPVPLVYANTVPAGAVTRKSFQAIAGRQPEVFQGFCRIKLIQFPNGNVDQRPWAHKSCNARVAPIEEVLRSTIAERLDHHYNSITEYVL